MPSIDLFIVAGQSNAEGRGSSATSPTVTGGSLEWTGSALVTLDDPVGGADTGSAWPAFANAYETASDVSVCISESATGGTGLQAGTGGSDDWSETGTLFDAAVTKAVAARNALINAGWSPSLRGVLWHQGERDALGYTGGDLVGDYADALVALLVRFDAALSATLNLYVFQLGAPASGDIQGFADVRQAQYNAAIDHPRIYLAYRRCVDFASLGWMVDEYHYTQTGLNDMGTIGGAGVAGVAGQEHGTIIPGVAGDAVGGAIGVVDGAVGVVF